MRKGGSVEKKKQPDAIDKVEELLKLTEDDLLLKVTIDSHIKSKSNFDFLPESSHTNAIHPDLNRRFEALRSKPSTPNPSITVNPEDVDNLFARFAALKHPSKARTTSNSTSVQHANAVKDNALGIVDVEDEEDEVSKIISWAIDAALLDPSPSSDIDDESESDSDSDSKSDDDASRTVDRKKKTSKK